MKPFQLDLNGKLVRFICWALPSIKRFDFNGKDFCWLSRQLLKAIIKVIFSTALCLALFLSLGGIGMSLIGTIAPDWADTLPTWQLVGMTVIMALVMLVAMLIIVAIAALFGVAYAATTEAIDNRRRKIASNEMQPSVIGTWYQQKKHKFCMRLETFNSKETDKSDV